MNSLWVLITFIAIVGIVVGVEAYKDWKTKARALRDASKSKNIKFNQANDVASLNRNQRDKSPSKTVHRTSRPKTPAEVFKVAFPGLKVVTALLPNVPFALRIFTVAEARGSSSKLASKFAVEIYGSISLTVAHRLILLLTIEDITTGVPKQVFGTVDHLQDERTGLFVERVHLGGVSPPGRHEAVWREVALIPVALLQSSNAGRRRLRFSCIGVPAQNASASVIDPLLRSEVLCSAVAEVEAELPTKGYLDKDHDREQAAGMILCIAWGFARALGNIDKKTESIISAWSGQAPSLLGGASGLPSASLTHVLDGAAKFGQFRGMEFLSACELLAKSPVTEAPLMALDLCCRIAKASFDSTGISYALLRDGALAMGVVPDEFTRLMRTYLESPSPETYENLVGLDPSWDKQRTIKFLSEQFGKWNARSSSERDPVERGIIAMRLNAIAKLRQRY